MHISRLILYLALVTALSGCGNYLPISVTSEVIGKKVADGVFGKVVFDPIWEFFFGTKNSNELEGVKNDLVKTATQKILDTIIPSAQAGEQRFKCEANDSQEECRMRAASVAETGFDVYASRFVASFKKCRDDVVLTPSSGALDYPQQVEMITQCIADSGYRQEIAIILNNIHRRSAS